MTKQAVAVPEAVAAVPSPPSSAAPPLPYPPPRSRCLHARMDRAAAAAAAGAGAGAGAGAVAGGFVESMRASSPTHARAAAAAALAPPGLDDESYAMWTLKHPSALAKFDELVAASKGKRVVVFLDYDGTLSPIVDDPDAAYMSDAMRRAVRSVAKHFPTAIVSGRCRDKVFEFVKLAELYYAGSHGMDIRGPDRGSRHAKAKRVLFQPASQFLPMIEQVHESLVEKTKCIPGAKVENNRFCVSVHFRCVDEKSWGTLADVVNSVLGEYPALKLTQGRKVLEVRPTIEWDKGRALEFLLGSLGLAGRADVLPVYVGDDRTDEDAFRALRRRGRGQGVGVLVSAHPRDTAAAYSLRDPAEVMEFLLRLVEWQRLSKAGRPKW